MKFKFRAPGETTLVTELDVNVDLANRKVRAIRFITGNDVDSRLMQSFYETTEARQPNKQLASDYQPSDNVNFINTIVLTSSTGASMLHTKDKGYSNYSTAARDSLTPALKHFMQLNKENIYFANNTERNEFHQLFDDYFLTKNEMQQNATVKEIINRSVEGYLKSGKKFSLFEQHRDRSKVLTQLLNEIKPITDKGYLNEEDIETIVRAVIKGKQETLSSHKANSIAGHAGITESRLAKSLDTILHKLVESKIVEQNTVDTMEKEIRDENKTSRDFRL